MKFVSLIVVSFIAQILNTLQPSPQIVVCDNQPELNKKIVRFVKSNINKKVGRGECWDLAAEALKSVNAKWDNNLKFGNEVDLKKKECVYPGDIIQFEGVEVEYREKNAIFSESYFHHTSVIVDVIDQANFKIANQNTTRHGRKVGIDALSLKNITKGSYTIYRPVK